MNGTILYEDWQSLILKTFINLNLSHKILSLTVFNSELGISAQHHNIIFLPTVRGRYKTPIYHFTGRRNTCVKLNQGAKCIRGKRCKGGFEACPGKFSCGKKKEVCCCPKTEPTPNPKTEPTTAAKTAPTTAPTTNEPTTGKPTTGEPTTAEPTTGEPTTAESTTAEPTTAEPTTESMALSGKLRPGFISLLILKLSYQKSKLKASERNSEW